MKKFYKSPTDFELNSVDDGMKRYDFLFEFTPQEISEL